MLASALREREARFRGVLEQVRAVAVAIAFDAAGRATFAADSLLTLTGWSRQEAVGSDGFTRHRSSSDTARRPFDSMLADGREASRCPDGPFAA